MERVHGMHENQDENTHKLFEERESKRLCPAYQKVAVVVVDGCDCSVS